MSEASTIIGLVLASSILLADGSLGSALGGTTAALAIVAVALQLQRWLHDRRIRNALRREIEDLRRIDEELRRLVIEIDAAFTEGVGWAGMAAWPEPLSDRVSALVSLRSELRETTARLRAIWAVGATERARAFLEQGAQGLRAAVELYLRGTTAQYFESDLGAAIPHSATGRGYVHPIPIESIEQLVRLRREVRDHLEVAVRQLGEQLTSSGWAVWPIREWEAEADPNIIDAFALPAGTD